MADSRLLLSGAGVRALLVGSARHVPGALVSDVPAAGASARELAQALERYGGLPQSQITCLYDPREPRQVTDAITELAEQASEVALFSYAGHGLLGPDNELYLATQATKDLGSGSAMYQALPFKHVRELLSQSSARLTVVILDCCWAGRAEGWPGSYLITAVGSDEAAWAVPGEAVTAFTGALIDVLAEGDPEGPRMLTLDDVHDAVARRMRGRGLPEPRRQAVDAGLLRRALAPNGGYPAPAARTAPGLADGGWSPYLGLRAYHEQDAEYFFGRDALIAEVERRVRDLDKGVLVVTGPSGSGKSSLLRAGLVPALGPARCLVVPSGTQLPDGVPEGRVVIVDQFEEIFAHPEPSMERLTELAGRVPVVLAVRADFFGHCAEHQVLLRALDHPLVVGPMAAAELREAIEQPALRAGLSLESGLTDRLLREAGPGTVLPLLSHALLATWQRREDRVLTHAGYEATGGIREALAQTAERTLADLAPGQREQARRILIDLVRLGDGTDDTRVSRKLSELASGQALDAFVNARLITVDDSEARITHEALIREWPTLRGWLDADRQSLIARQQLADDAIRWDSGGHRRGYLYSSARLAALGQIPPDLAPTALAFYRAGRRWRRQLRLAGAAGFAVLLAVTILAVVNANRAASGSRDALSRQLAAQSEALGSGDPATAGALAATAWQFSRTAEARHAVLSALADPARAVLPGHPNGVQALAVSPDGRLLVSGEYDGTIQLWDPVTYRQAGRPLDADGPTEVLSLAFTPDGRTLVSFEDGATIRLWDMGTRTLRTTIKPRVGGAPSMAAVSPDGRMIASGGENDGAVRLWSVSTGEPVGEPLTGHEQTVLSVAFSPDGRMLASGGTDGTVRLWDPDRHRPIGGPLDGHKGGVTTVAFSPDGRSLASGGSDGEVKLWDVRGPEPHAEVIAAHTGGVKALAFSPDGTALASGSYDGTIRLWNPATRRQLGPTLAGHRDGAFSLAFVNSNTLASGGGAGDRTVRLWDLRPRHQTRATVKGAALISLSDRALLTAGDDRAARLWKLPGGTPEGEPIPSSVGAITSVALNPDGKTLAIGGENGVQLCDTSARCRFVLPGAEAPVFSADGKTMATGGPQLSLWDVATGARTAQLPAGNPVHDLAFSPAGRYLAGTQETYGVRVWDVERRAPLDNLRPTGQGVLAFSPLGDLLATSGGQDHTVRFWDPRTGAQVGAAITTGSRMIGALAVSPDGRLLAGGSRADNGGSDAEGVWLWDVSTRRQLGAPLNGGGGDLRSVAFSPSGRYLAAGTVDDTVDLWDVTLPGDDQLTRAACELAGRSLTQQEWQEYGLPSPYVRVC